MSWSLKDCKAREAKYRATLVLIPGGVPTATDEDRAQFLALVERIAALIKVGIDGCSCGRDVLKTIRDECDWCEDARKLLREIEGGAK